MATPPNNSVAQQRFQIKLHTYQFNGVANIPEYKWIKSAQDTWAKQSKGTITLLWDKIIQGNVDPCGLPGCTASDDDNLLYIRDNDPSYLWTIANYFVQKFPDRLGIDVVHIKFLFGENPGGTLAMPSSQPGQFSGVSNIIVVPDDTSDVLKHEVGHVLGLQHVSDPFNLMCGAPPGSGFFVGFWDALTCTETLATHLN